MTAQTAFGFRKVKGETKEIDVVFDLHPSGINNILFVVCWFHLRRASISFLLEVIDRKENYQAHNVTGILFDLHRMLKILENQRVWIPLDAVLGISIFGIGRIWYWASVWNSLLQGFLFFLLLS